MLYNSDAPSFLIFFVNKVQLIFSESNSIFNSSVSCVVNTICAQVDLFFLLWNFEITNFTNSG